MQHNKQPLPSLKAMAAVYESFMLQKPQRPHSTFIIHNCAAYMFLLYCPPTSNKEF